ncbi:matrixin family metalloprotease [bacterium]|nr:matrixin family metalloprotease [bacterium]
MGSCGKKGLTLKIGDQDVLALGNVDSCNFVQSASGLRVSWKSSTPVKFIIGSSVPTKYDATIVKAATVWNNYMNRGLISVHRDNTLTNSPGDDRYNLIYWVTDWPDEQAMEQARTGIRWDVSKLRDADIKINADNFEFYADGETNTTGKVSLLSLMIHEMGHGIGLKHINDIVSVMFTHLATGTERSSPAKVDTDSLGCEY